MSIGTILAKEVEQEAAVTRRLLERIPDEKLDWKPHKKSLSFRELASHIVSLMEWTEATLKQDEVNITGDYKAWRAASQEDLLKKFEKGLASAVSDLKACPDSEMAKPWALKNQGAVLFSFPRNVVVRAFILSHLIHHRGQLSVYLRLNDIPVPSIYGPSADEAP